MVSFFKDKSAVSVFWLIIICCGLHVYSLIHPPALSLSVNDGFFYYLLVPFINLQPYTISVIYVLLIFLLALQINFISNDLQLLSKQSYTPALAFILLSALLPAFNTISAALLSCNFIIWILYSACCLYNKPNAKAAIYNLGFFTAISIILYYPMLPLALIILIAFIIIRSFKLNEFFVLIFGILTPFYLLISYLFLKDELNMIPQPNQLFSFYFTATPHISTTIIAIAIAAFITLWAMLIVQKTGSRELIQVRKSWKVVAVFLILYIPAIVFMRNAWPAAVLIAMIPASCYIGFAFGSASRNIVPVAFFWLLVGLSIYNNWFAKY